MTLTIPLPPSGCSPNTYKHWRVVAKAKKEYREAARLICLSILGREVWRSPIKIHATFDMGPSPTKQLLYRPRDIANAISSLKSAVDGFVDAGLVPDDSHQWVSWGDITLNRNAKAHGGRCGVTIRIEVLE
jgi:hypothetical protein